MPRVKKKQETPPTGICEFPARLPAHRAQYGNMAPFNCAVPMRKQSVRHSYKWDPKIKKR